MCDELNEEVNDGVRIATALVEHLVAMGAGAMERKIILEGKVYSVRVALETGLAPCGICGVAKSINKPCMKCDRVPKD